MQTKYFISIDWGTSNFRMRLIDVSTLDIIEVIESSKGAKTLYNDWLKVKGDKEQLFLSFLKSQLQKFKTSIDNSTCIIISGMASSSIGLRELPYAELPFSPNGKELYIEKINTPIINHSIYLISGVKTSDDVIRGEEVQILGLISDEDLNKTTMFILPGTHSKHIILKNNVVIDFKTFMTGEIFDVISKHTILKNSLAIGKLKDTELTAFKEGVLKSDENSSILNALFKIRTFDLFKEKTTTENFHYLSGLLIGEELKTLKDIDCNTIKLCAGGNLFELYYQGIKTLDLASKIEIVSKETVDISVVKGQFQLLKRLEA